MASLQRTIGEPTPPHGQAQPWVPVKCLSPCAGCKPCTMPAYDCRLFGPLAFAVKLSDCLAGVVFDYACPTGDYRTVALRIRKRGFSHKPHPFLLEYKAFAVEGASIIFRFDSQTERLPPSRYEAVLLDGCKECGSFELKVTDRCAVSLRSHSVLPYHGVAPQTRRPEGANAMFDTLAGFEVTSCAVYEVGGTGLPLSATDRAALCAKLVGVCRPVELVIDDGVNREVVLVSGCTSGIPNIQRAQGTSRQHRFPAGTTIRFEWTMANVAAMAAGCP